MSTITRKLSTYYYPNPTIAYLFSSLWLFLAAISTGVAVLFGLHEKLDINLYRIFDLSFYYFIPAFLWILITPLIFSWTNQDPIYRADWKKPLQKHLLRAFLLAPFMRFGALWLDFSIKYIIGMTATPPLVILADVYLVGIASIPRDIFNYFLVVGIFTAWKYWQARPIAPISQAISIKDGKRSFQLSIVEIYWIEAAGNYVRLHTINDSFRVRKTIKQMGKDLGPSGFLRIHRSILVNPKQVQSLCHWRSGEYLVAMKNEKHLTSSRTYLPNIHKMRGQAID